MLRHAIELLLMLFHVVCHAMRLAAVAARYYEQVVTHSMPRYAWLRRLQASCFR